MANFSTQSRKIFCIPQEIIKQALNPSYDIPCSIRHQHSCLQKLPIQFRDSVKGVGKLYLIAHLISFIIFKRKKFLKDPIKQLKQFLKGFVLSILYVGGYTTIVRGTFCFVHKIYGSSGNLQGPTGAFCGGIALAFEPIGRQTQIALFCLNKSIQTLYNIALRRNLIIKIPKGQCILMGFSASILLYFYLNHRQLIKKSYISILDKILGQQI